MNEFHQMDFIPGQCRILAISGTRTNISFIACNFGDDGVAFLEALTARDDQDTGPAKLSINGNLTADEDNFVLSIDQLNLDYLELSNLALESEQACRVLAAAKINYLSINHCRFEDDWAALVEALVESIRAERGPKGLHLDLDHSLSCQNGSTSS
jgi:hypothetical protein